MIYRLPFRQRHSYSDSIQVPVVLSLGARSVDLKAHLDTGAQYCLFERDFGERLGLATESGQPRFFVAATGDKFAAFGFEIDLEVLGFTVTSTVFFARDPGFRKNVLGRNGWLNKFRVALIDHDSLLYLDTYDQA
ncbi:MAG: aspartyl protease family protein [Bryobacteraceae bacterium]